MQSAIPRVPPKPTAHGNTRKERKKEGNTKDRKKEREGKEGKRNPVPVVTPW